MFVRLKNTHGYHYPQIVENRRAATEIEQPVVATLGQADALMASGKLYDPTRSLAKFSPTLKLLDAQRCGSLQAHRLPINCIEDI